MTGLLFRSRLSGKWLVFCAGMERRDGNRMRLGFARGGYWEFRSRHHALQFAAKRGIRIQ